MVHIAGLDLRRREKSAATAGIQIPDCPTHILITIPSILSQLQREHICIFYTVWWRGHMV